MENYHILERIGEGSFGKVYRGRRKYTGHVVALKFVTKQGKSVRDLENLRQEINILRRLNHCNIIAMMDSFETEREFCMVTEYAQGELFQVLEDEHSLPEEEIKKLAIQLIQALYVLHSNRIIHRDMKPQNILIGSKQQIKLCDFGFARAIAHDSSLLRSIKGTPLYMAPELVQEKPYNYTVDLWSLGVILYELAVGKPPFYTDRIVSLIQMIVRDDVKYPSTMSADFQSLLKGLLNKNPAQRLKWPKILDHPFIRETPEQLETRLQLQRQIRSLPRFFSDQKSDEFSQNNKEEKVKPSLERLLKCDEWKICDPETGQQLSQPEMSCENISTSPMTPIASKDDDCEPSPLSKPPRPVSAVALESFVAGWDQLNKELDIKNLNVDLISTPLFCKVVSMLPSIAAEELLSSSTLNKIGALLHILYRTSVLRLKESDTVTDLSDFLRAKSSIHSFLMRLVEACVLVQEHKEQISDVIYKSVRCCMIFTTLINSIGAENKCNELPDYRVFCMSDVQVILLMLTSKDQVVAVCHSKALKWLGSMIDQSLNLTTLLEIVYPSGLIQTLCKLLQASSISETDRDVGMYTIFALASFVQPGAKCWSPLPPFPVFTLVRESHKVLKAAEIHDVKPLYKLRVKIHTEVGLHLLSSGVKELLGTLGNEIHERIQNSDAEMNEEDDIGEEDADQSTICCILKILLHACRSSAPLSKKLTVTNILFQNHPDADIIMILTYGYSHRRLHQIEQYFATELLSVMLRRRVLPKRQIWQCAKMLYPIFEDANDSAVLSASSSFFAEIIESCNLDESALDSDSLETFTTQHKELWNLVVHGSISVRCFDAILRLFRTSATATDVSASKSEMLTSYNIRAQGLLDSGVVLLLRIASKASAKSRSQVKEAGATRSEEMSLFLSVFEHAHVWKVFADMMYNGGADLLSPWGLFCFLKLLRTVREVQCNEPEMEIAVNEHLLKHLVNLLQLKHIEYLFHWPELVGGGSNAVKALVHATVKVLGIPFAHSVSEELLIDTQEILYDTNCVQKLLGVLRFVFSTKELLSEATVLELPISFLSRLVTSSTHFGSQFVKADGVLVIKECGMLGRKCSPSLIIDTLLILSQLARTSPSNYDYILQADLLPEFCDLTQHSEAMVRAKTLNCIGNLCRHSAYFYQHFITPTNGDSSNTILAGTIRGLLDPDNYVRRFACFAIGNAAFHSGELYNALRPTIPLLIQNLHNDEEKTRSNAGGALGNLVRNSDELCIDLCTHEAPCKLLKLAMTETSTASRRIVLFSLGNFCVYPECYNFLLETAPDFVEELEHLYDKVVADEVSRRNIRRILAKIDSLENEEEESSRQ
ncbi:ulk fused protein kinase [Plasmopara halstedii]|uniref:non-specific serine/threonine protein kinase n=1 Tax=Plasmopara halstedii TaxID=4781 RepID=A0A0P1AP94_PLAHL|nr:ulk fused protein kinase [Plasmopara halstedii]CEG42671.1 ulk fused protein kinase [Plasmopara halstedii]|eukprot:XP_024579040.1 ulk fused protein kinase [Plasmopara halstedii]